MLSAAGRLGTLGNKAAVYLDYWTPQNPNAQFQKPSAGYNSVAAASSTMFTQSDAIISNSFSIRLKNVSLSYDLPIINNDSPRIKIYVQGQNLLLISNYIGVSPEFNLPGFSSPQRVFSTGFNLIF